MTMAMPNQHNLGLKPKAPPVEPPKEPPVPPPKHLLKRRAVPKQVFKKLIKKTIAKSKANKLANNLKVARPSKAPLAEEHPDLIKYRKSSKWTPLADLAWRNGFYTAAAMFTEK